MLKPVYWIAICLIHPTLAVLTTFGKSTSKVPGLDEPHNFRLPTSVKPEHYKLEIVTHLGDDDEYSFTGKVWIKINCDQDTNNITLHSKDLDVNTDKLVLNELRELGNRSVLLERSYFETKYNFLVILPMETLKKGQNYELYIPFKAELEHGLFGYYRSSYVDLKTLQRLWISVTNFESTYARTAFPCFDEPEMKAKFEVILGHEKKYSALSNMPVKNTVQMKDKPQWAWSHFEVTVPMSTYLVAYSINDFEYKESVVETTNDVLFRIWARRDVLDHVEYARHAGPKLLKFYEDYFDIKFPLPKIDMIAVPDLLPEAMENWGLITYRETELLFSPNISSSSSQYYIASIIAHELAHQWFGNMITMRWWNDLWLKEGFATYFTTLGLKYLHPEWNSFPEGTVSNVLESFTFDSLASSHPVSVTIGDPNVISQIYDTVSYEKGSSIIRMMHLFLGEEAFRSGVKNYLKKHKYGNAEQDNLWECLTEAAHKQGSLPESNTVKEIMDSWTLQPGYPIVTVNRNYANKTAEVSQEPYIWNFQLRSSFVERCWWIPLSYTSSEKLDFNNTQTESWLRCKYTDKNVSIPKALQDLPDEREWVIFNIEMSGLYKVKYDARNWDLLIAQLSGPEYNKIPSINRAQLIDDALDLAWTGDQDYSIALRTVEYLKHEKEYIPWKAALDNLNAVNLLLRRSSQYGLFKKYMQSILEQIYKSLGGLTIDKKDRLDAVKHKALIASWSCDFSVGDCEMRSKQLFTEWMSTNDPDEMNPVPLDLRDAVYCTAIRLGSETEWNFLWKRYVASNVGTEKVMILESLGCSREIWLLVRYLDWTVDDSSGIRKQDTDVVFYAIASNDVGFHLAKTFLFERINDICTFMEPAGPSLATYIQPLASQMFKRDENIEMKGFFRRNSVLFEEDTLSIENALETILVNTLWMDSNYKSFGRIIKDFVSEQEY